MSKLANSAEDAQRLILPQAIDRIRRKLAGSNDGDRQMAKILAMVERDATCGLQRMCPERWWFSRHRACARIAGMKPLDASAHSKLCHSGKIDASLREHQSRILPFRFVADNEKHPLEHKGASHHRRAYIIYRTLPGRVDQAWSEDRDASLAEARAWASEFKVSTQGLGKAGRTLCQRVARQFL